jgi:uncharacterized protein YgbK (DUF1537 family)
MREYFLADDLSGALDAAAAFHHAGRRVRIVLSADDWIAADDEVLGVTTETRNAPAATAAATVRRAIARGRQQGARLVYKKIDSTLRGPVAAEIAALASELPGTDLLFTPANPGVGRTVRAGVLRVHGVPVSETEFARDPASPVTESNLHRLLGNLGGTGLHIADAESPADLAQAVAHRESTGRPWVAVGSGALARPVAALAARHPLPPPATSPALAAGPILLLGGSAHATNRAQAARLADLRGLPLHTLRLADPAAAVTALVASLRAAGGGALLVEETRHDSAVVLRTLTDTAERIIAATGANRIFATGGETAFALCTALGVSTLHFRDEIESGLALAGADTTRGPIRLAVKPGGFGTADTWLRAWDRLLRDH